MDLYFARYDGQAVATEEFILAMEEVSGKDLSQFCRWYHQAGTPVLRVKTVYDAAKKTYELVVKQSCPETPNQSNKATFHMPFAVGLVGSDCEDMELQLEGEDTGASRTKILDITKSEETFTFVNVLEEPAPSFLRHFSAPVALQYEYTDEQLVLLFECDSDPFARWEAGQRFMLRVIDRVASEVISGQTPVVSATLVGCFQRLLSSEMDDLSLLSRLLCFPSLKYLTTHLSEFDLDVVYAAKDIVEKTIAIKLENVWLSILQKYVSTEQYVYEIHACGRRRLVNQCLYYLLKTKNDEYYDMVYQRVLDANNMTDCLGALKALNDHPVPQREQALSHFYHTYQHEPLVVNKWLTLHATSVLSSVLDAVKALLNHPAFDFKNPNNIYALLVAFGENTLRFHDKSGMAYRFLADEILKLDAENPQVAARVVQPLIQWQKMDEIRGTFMRAELQRIADQKNLSSNLYEIVMKSLA